MNETLVESVKTALGIMEKKQIDVSTRESIG